jgi:hypothetical protein
MLPAGNQEMATCYSIVSHVTQDGDTSACVVLTIDQASINVRGDKYGRNAKQTTHFYMKFQSTGSFFDRPGRPSD